MRVLGFLALGALVALICRQGLGMAFWPSLVACVLASVAITCLMEMRR